MMKRIVSMLLAVAICIGLLPGISFAAESGSFKLDFGTIVTSKLEAVTSGEKTNYFLTNADGIEALGSAGDWSVVKDKEKTTALNEASNKIKFLMKAGTKGRSIQVLFGKKMIDNGNNAIEISFTVAKGGEYNISNSAYYQEQQGKMRFYIDGKELGTHQYGTDENKYTIKELFKNITLTEGVHTLRVVADDVGVKDRGYWTVEYLQFDNLDDLKLGSVELIVEKSKLEEEKSTKGTLSLKARNGEDYQGEYTVEYKSSSPTVEVKKISDSECGISAVALGKATVTAVVTTVDGTFEATAEIDVVEKVIPEEIKIDFTQTVEEEDRGIPSVSPGYTVDASGTTRTFRKFTYPDSGRSLLHVQTGGSKNLWPNNPLPKTSFIFDIEAIAEADYQVSLLGGSWYAGGIYSVFANDNYLGDVSFWDGTVYEKGVSESALKTGELQRLNTVHLKAGKNKIIFRLRQIPGYPSAYLLLDTMTFTPVDGTSVLSEICAEVPKKLAIGESFSSAAYVKMSDGSIYNFGITADGKPDEKNIFTAALSNDAFAEFSGFTSYEPGRNGASPFTVRGKEEGTVNIVFSANVGDTEKEISCPIEVSYDPLVSTGVEISEQELFVGSTAELTAKPMLRSGRIITSPEVTSTFKALDESIFTVEGKTLTAVSAGTGRLEVTSSFNEDTVTEIVEIKILPESMTSIRITAGGSERIRLTDDPSDTVPLYVQAISNLGSELDMTAAEVSAVALTPEIAELDEENNIIPRSEGDAKLRATVMLGGRKAEAEVTLAVVRGKTKASYMTEQKAEIVRENVSKYDWAKAQAEKYIQDADKFVDELDKLYEAIPSEGLPRSFSVGGEGDPNMYCCRYCGVDLLDKYGSYPWLHNVVSRAWKIQCPDCKRLFPSNEFGKFYELGLNEYGEFDRMRALEAHREMFGDKTVSEPGEEHSSQWKKYYGYGVKGGFLTNTLYSELEKAESINCGEGLREGETEETWGVDDGFGYVPSHSDGRPYVCGTKEVVERHTYIAEYIHSGLWYHPNGKNSNYIREAINNSAYAYYFTGEEKYGRVAAVLLDRIADFLPDYDISLYGDNVWNSDGGLNIGKSVGCIWECTVAEERILAYDMVFDMYEDESVLEYIKNKQKYLKFRYAKETPSQIRTNIEDGLIRTSLEGLRDCSVSGNFGLPQSVNAVGAVVLDSMPDTEKWLDYLMAPGWVRSSSIECTGGGVAEQLTDDIDSDGQGTEGSNYNTGWHTNLIKINKYIDEYGKYSKFNLYNNPKFVQMFYSTLPLMSAYYTPQIGDTKACLGKSFWTRSSAMLEGWTRLKDPVFAQMLYKLNNNSADELKYDIYTKDPERLESEVKNIIEQYGEYYRDSELMTNFGFAILRDGTEFNESVGATAVDNRRDMWMYFGTNAGHAHLDTLNIGMTAYGLNFLPELGYPETTGNQPNRLQWIDATLSHNTVMVDGKAQTENKNTTAEVRGKIKHFDDAGAVALMDVSAPYVYDSTDEYRRSVVMIRVDDEISYAVDFFRVLGGNEHLYSFHASSNEISETQGLDFTLVEDEDGNYISGSQLDENGNYKGTYAGRDVTYIKNTKTGAVRKNDGTLKENEKVLELEFGDDPNSAANRTNRTLFPAGYTWLNNVDRDTEPENKVEIDFSIKDFNKAIKNSSGLHMRMTVHNATNVENGAKASVAIADGYPPRYVENKNIDKFKYVLVKNEGNALDTVFTTVLEPYRTARYLKDSNELSMSVYSGEEAEGDAARALRIEHKNGRIDYVFYATNNKVTYEVADGDKKLYFRGFAGVYTLNKAGENIYTYVNDGDVIGSSPEKLEGVTGRINAVVQSFTDVPAEKNEIVIAPASPLTDEEIKNLAGKNIHIDNGALVRSGTFQIENAYPEGENIVLDVGRISPVRKYKDAYAPESGYECMIKAGQNAYIPLSYSEDNAPEFDPVSDSITVSAGSSVSVTVCAESPLEGKSITYQAETLPRGASLNETTGVVTWKPDSSQIGENHVAITACDNDGRTSTLHFAITVYGSTTGSSSNKKEESTGNEGAAGGGGGGGGGGGAPPTDKPDAENSSDQTDVGEGGSDVPQDEDSTQSDNTEKEPEASGETDVIRFTDISDHAWAADAINTLADDGIIRGTTSDTYSPANNITRADFASLLVRAFELESSNTENFADVSVNDYFAKELAVARNNGIISGIGDNKFAPRNTITRQDMMVIVHRALQKLNVGFGESIEPNYEDFTTVAPYAREAVSALIGAGLVNGKSGSIAPTDYTTRAEVAVLLKRILEFIK